VAAGQQCSGGFHKLVEDVRGCKLLVPSLPVTLLPGGSGHSHVIALGQTPEGVEWDSSSLVTVCWAMQLHSSAEQQVLSTHYWPASRPDWAAPQGIRQSSLPRASRCTTADPNRWGPMSQGSWTAFIQQSVAVMSAFSNMVCLLRACRIENRDSRADQFELFCLPCPLMAIRTAITWIALPLSRNTHG